MDESPIVLMMLLRFRIADVLFLNIKGSGGYDGGGYKKECFFIEPTNLLTAGMHEFLEGDEWQHYVKPEADLYAAANRSLDSTIERLGRVEFEANLAKYREAKK